MKNRLLIIANSSKALIYEIDYLRINKLIQTLSAQEADLSHIPQKEGFFHKASTQSHFFDPHQEAKEIDRKGFSKKIAGFLLSYYNQEPFSSLVLIAEPKVLGDLRKAFDPKILSLMTNEIHKDIVHLKTKELDQYLKNLWEKNELKQVS